LARLRGLKATSNELDEKRVAVKKTLIGVEEVGKKWKMELCLVLQVPGLQQIFLWGLTIFAN
jgi:hypothetical protein